ncbi:hypothetical protein KSP40_PGU012873 [Platanthera guangdongensis]|uniref:Uncharacterized protein n=1 Tax=Platanthera guangdongensis TaxID=2320717 RepID=A0ABR2N2L4_9ASPA
MGEDSNYAAESSLGGRSRHRKMKHTPGDTITNAINRMADSMDHATTAITRSSEASRVNTTQIYEALAQLPDLQNLELAKAMDLLAKEQNGQFQFLQLKTFLQPNNKIGIQENQNLLVFGFTEFQFFETKTCDPNGALGFLIFCVFLGVAIAITGVLALLLTAPTGAPFLPGPQNLLSSRYSIPSWLQDLLSERITNNFDIPPVEGFQCKLGLEIISFCNVCILRLHLVRRWRVDPADGNGVFEPEGGGGCTKLSFLGCFSRRAGGNGVNAVGGSFVYPLSAAFAPNGAAKRRTK